MKTNMEFREAKKEDLTHVLKLYKQLAKTPVPKPDDRIKGIWSEILADKNNHVVVGIVDNSIVSSCVIVIVKNLTHSGRPYALIENVITDVAYRNKGYGTQTLDFARLIAKKENCYKIMLLTGRKTDDILNFYRHAGYNSNDKTAFIQWLD